MLIEGRAMSHAWAPSVVNQVPAATKKSGGWGQDAGNAGEEAGGAARPLPALRQVQIQPAATILQRLTPSAAVPWHTGVRRLPSAHAIASKKRRGMAQEANR